ncbi:MAG: LamG-like jellyroll fold domain-containing protein, partial [Limisphaerales bacterium]
MQKKIPSYIAASILALAASGAATWAQTYSNAVMGLNPAAYWPLNETAQPPQILDLTATNSGSAGSAGNGYYGGWYQASGNQWYLTNNAITEAGPISGDVALDCQKTQGQYIIVPRRTNGVVNAAVTITEPFSIEAWINLSTISSGLLSIISQGGETTMNIGGPNSTNQFYGGSTAGWDGFALGTYQNFFYFDCYQTNGESKKYELDGPKTLQVGQWVYLVCTLNGGVETMYTNGVQYGKTITIPPNGAGLTYVVDPTSPLIIGAGPAEPVSYGNAMAGGLAEVAIYNQALGASQVQAHYQAATSVASYTDAVLADSPVLYYRVDDGEIQTNAGYPSASFPVATNYGTLGAAADGVYQPGTTPGLDGPPYAGFGSNSKSVAINGWLGAVDVGNSNLPSELNPTGAVPMSVVAWYQTAPADN